MRIYSVRNPLGQEVVGNRQPILEGAQLAVATRYGVGALVLWLAGIQFASGWSLETAGSPNFSGNIMIGLVAVLLVAPFVAGAAIAGLKVRAVPGGVALALGLILIAMSFPFGAVTGTIYTAIGGVYPDMSGLGNRALPMLVPI